MQIGLDGNSQSIQERNMYNDPKSYLHSYNDKDSYLHSYPYSNIAHGNDGCNNQRINRIEEGDNGTTDGL